MGSNDALSKKTTWLSLYVKMQKKTEEYGRPSPVGMLIGAVSGAVGMGGAALGCMFWKACKDIVAMRANQYYSLAMVGYVSTGFLALGALAACMAAVMLDSEMKRQAKPEKKKKKKKDDEEEALCDAEGKVASANCAACCCILGSQGWTILSANMIRSFQTIQYWKYSKLSAGPFMAGVSGFLIVLTTLYTLKRAIASAYRGDEDENKGKGKGKFKGKFGKGPPM